MKSVDIRWKRLENNFEKLYLRCRKGRLSNFLYDSRYNWCGFNTKLIMQGKV